MVLLAANIFGRPVRIEEVLEYRGDNVLVSLGQDWDALVPREDLFIMVG